MNLILDDVEEEEQEIFRWAHFLIFLYLPNVHTLKSGTSILFRVDYLSKGKMFKQNLLKRCNTTTTSLSLSLSL